MKRFIVLFCILFFETNVTFGQNQDRPKICPEIISKEAWGGRNAIVVEYTIVPVGNVIIHHTVTPECNNTESCSNMLKSIQNFHIDDLEFHDIGYNFLVGSDGRIYEGAGWHKVGAHTRGYNSRSLGLAFIGNFSDKSPNSKQLQAAQYFLQCGVELGELSRNYKLFGARQVSATLSPGTRLYFKLKTWPHYTQNP